MTHTSSSNKCKPIYAGNVADSELETKAVINFINSKLKNWISYISIHSYGGFWLYWNERSKMKRSDFIDIVNHLILPN